MKRIFKSVFVIGLVLVAVVGVTRAYFSDTEESVNNRFQAGAIDLKVDSDGHYNGLECVEEKWQDCVYTGEGATLITNGGFEQPEVTDSANWELFSSILGWTIAWESTETSYDGQTRPAPALQEYHEGVNGWLAYEGDQYAELDTDWDGPSGSLTGEPALVRISQDVATTVGEKYRLSFAFSARPGTGTSENELKVKVGGVEMMHTEDGTGDSQTDWQVKTYDFTATAVTTTIEFAGAGTADSLGVFLDDVAVVHLQRDCTPSTEYTEACYSSWNLTDLGPENKFFSFSDLKPGDWGENTVSLHVYNNDAYACVYTRNYTDEEVDPAMEPEIEAGDLTTDAGLQGELGQHIKFFLWNDDGDNVWEDGEEPLNGEPMLASEFANGWRYGIALPANPMPASQTKFFGVAWCFGEMNVDYGQHTITCDGSQASYNEAQTDAISADIGFYVEQARNNDEFTCDRIPSPTPVNNQ